MAFQEYDITASVQKMTARQLRLYISRAGKEAQARVDSFNTPDDMPEPMKDIFMDIAGHDNKVRYGTSRMSKADMVEYAKKLRDFNFMDTKSKYARDDDYKNNKERYEKFIREQMKKPGGEYWKKYMGANGRIMKSGYRDYKEYVNMIKNILPYLDTYGYMTIKKTYREAKANMRDPQRVRTIENLLIKTYEENKGKDLTPEKLNDAFFSALRKYDEEHFDSDAVKVTKSETIGKPPKIKKAKKSKGNNIKAKTGKKMKSGKVRDKQGTS